MFLQDVSYVHQGCIRSKNKLETIRETVMLWNFKTENTCDAEETFLNIKANNLLPNFLWIHFTNH